MKLLNLKAIPVAQERNFYSINKKELDVVRKIKYRKSKKGFYLSETVTLLEDKDLAPLKKLIIKKAKEYTLDVLGIKDQIYLTQSWSTINLTHAFHKTHTHPNTFISLVYYAQCKDGFLFFDLNTSSLRECFNFSYTIDKYNIYNSESWQLPVDTGDIVLFPGHIRHGSGVNELKTPRIIIGANFFLKGKLGSTKEVSNIVL
jgi:uncharacterized protein (TIGR02466 family)